MIDSGIDLQSAEFGSRVDPASTSTAGNATIDDESGHGTAVAFTLAGRRNNTGTHGIAFDATLLIFRTDNPGSCTVSTGDNSGCKHDDRSIATALDLARTNNARVVNVSLGGSPASPVLVQAIDRATRAGIVIVISAGNDGTANPDSFAAIATNAAVSRGLVIIAGSVGTNDVISSFSNNAGTGANFFLSAVGEQVRAPNQENVPFLWSGTSFSAPQISGALALLAQAFPTLTGTQLVEILYSSARDAGAAGIDAVYGRGILDLTRAFAPIGQTSLAGSAVPVSLTSNGVLSSAMGDARQTGLGTVILDSFSRAYTLDLARTIGTARQQPALVGALTGRLRHFSAAVGSTAIAVTIAPGRDQASVERLRLSPGDAEQARSIAAMITSRLGSRAAFAFGFSQSAAAMGAQLAGRRDPAFLIAQTPEQALGFASNPMTAMALRRDMGRFGLTLATEQGAVLAPHSNPLLAQRSGWQRLGYGRVAIALDRRFSGLSTVLTATHLREQDSLLGAHFGAGLGAVQAASWFVDAAARLEAGGGWSIGAAYRRGWTFAHTRTGFSGSGLVGSEAFAADIGKNGIFSGHDSFGVRIAQPLRVTSGSGLDLQLPSYFDYSTGAVSRYDSQRLNLAPTGRELDLEMRYAVPFQGGMIQTNLYMRRDPGNVATLADDYGLALRYSLGF